MLFEDDQEDTKEQSISLNKIFGKVRSSFAGSNPIKILPETPKPNFQNVVKSSIFGFAGKIK